ncbi:MAG TPA: tetratricopeptide repeat protein [Terriglobia bacterium]|jgi:tetratricopeptide (TPR) repeat protein|nr:tetratricopeptide repeat protein [Terriglobia bacterium]
MMLRRVFAVLLVCLACASFANAGEKAPKAKSSKTKPVSGSMPVTAASDKARELYQKGMEDYENLYLERCNEDWRAAVKGDPTVAVAWAWIAFNSRNPAEVSAAREKAKALLPRVTPGEQLMIQWISNVQEGNYIAGIAAMNDLLAMFPKDKHLLYLAGNWLMGENGNDQALKILERALALDKNYPAALNDAAYVYARNREFAKAFSMMDRYLVVLPNEPNPHDSYGELLRMAGHFDEALSHYRMALKVDPKFASSQVGIADTYALMGNQAQARAEYDKAIAQAHNDADRIDYMMQKATTWVREANPAEADKAFAEAAQKAHELGLDLQEAWAHQRMAEYQADDAAALHHLEEAQAALTHRQDISTLDREEELSRILRHRAIRAAHAGNPELAQKSLKALETMASTSRNLVIQSSYHGAAGALLAGQEKWQDAIAQLEEDRDDPFSMQLLSRAYYESGASEKMHEVEERLRGTNVPTIEQAVVVPAARLLLPSTT